MSGRYYPNIYIRGCGAAYPVYLFFLQDSEQLCLKMQWKVRNFIKKQCAVVCLLKFSDLTFGACSRKGALLITKKLRLDKVFGQGSTVYRYKRSVLPEACIMDGSGKQLFPCTAGTIEKYCGVGFSSYFGLIYHVLHNLAASHNILKGYYIIIVISQGYVDYFI
ncbi:hypothetical protein SDC9_105646 [bioreactor metagenome]|uniref:Uncharacterized protein n=1 Tax=bioreactor metagenome TaxID=1076179 RepID=A0A645B6P1_9ZZZZ